jgi:hypothetical protein
MRRILFFIGIFIPFLGLTAAHLENKVDLHIKVEDGSYTLHVKEFRFNGEEIKLEDHDMFKPRKAVSYKLPPGRYYVNWSTEKGFGKWKEGDVKEHERIVVLESGDSVVRLSIKGENIAIY